MFTIRYGVMHGGSSGCLKLMRNGSALVLLLKPFNSCVTEVLMVQVFVCPIAGLYPTTA